MPLRRSWKWKRISGSIAKAEGLRFAKAKEVPKGLFEISLKALPRRCVMKPANGWQTKAQLSCTIFFQEDDCRNRRMSN
jgi:hypothetical protein